MKFVITGSSRTDFTAYAPMHKFKGWAVEGITGCFDIDFETMAVKQIEAYALNEFFDTGYADRNKAMVEFFNFKKNKQSSFIMTECREFKKLSGTKYKITMLGVLEFVGIRRQLPITCTLTRNKNLLNASMSVKWSFKAYGIKAPQLLFLKVRDIVDISADLELSASE